MAKVIGPWTPNYPVDFKSNGDTSRAAFGKHIQEIERIYGLLSGLGASKIEAEDLTAAMTANKNEWATAIAAEKSARESEIAAEVTARSNGDAALQRDLTTHINSTNPHPNLQLATLGGNLPFSRIEGSLGLDRTTGDLDASRIVNLPTSVGITNVRLGEDGYVKFGNGLMIQWGYTNISKTDWQDNEMIRALYFSPSFSDACYNVLLTTQVHYNNEDLSKKYNASDVLCLLVSASPNFFTFINQNLYGEADIDIISYTVRYIAIGK